MTEVLRSRAAWAVLGVVVVVTLVVGARGTGPVTPAQRERRLASEVRCPTCAGQSAELSDAEAAKAVRAFIVTQVQAGVSDGAILEQLRQRYGSDILLRPASTGVAGLVWELPVVGLVLALAGLVWAFRRWQASAGLEASDSDRRRVEEALSGLGGPAGRTPTGPVQSSGPGPDVDPGDPVGQDGGR